jgi:tetratricopeptide (TPR) repeat protein
MRIAMGKAKTTRLAEGFSAYERTLADFASRESGCFFALTHDQNLLMTLRNALCKDLGVPGSLVRSLGDPMLFLQELKTPLYSQRRALLLMERVLDGRSTLSFLRQLKATLDKVLVIVMTPEVERSVLVLLHEAGADNFIIKPASMATMVEKMAFTIRPQGQIGQLIDRARDALGRGRPEETLVLCREILELKPGSAAGLMLMGDAYRKMGRTDDAAAAYEEASVGAPLYLEPLKRMVALHKDMGDLDGQLAYLERLDRLSPLNVERKVEMGGIHLDKGRTERAGQLFDQAVKHAAVEAKEMIEEVKRQVAERCMEKSPEMAERFFRSILEGRREGLSTRDIATFNRLGMALRRQGKWREAVEEYRRAAQVAPGDENLLFNMAVAYSEGGRHREAVAALREVLALNPEFPEASPTICFHIGVMHLNAEDHTAARAFLAKTLELDPGHEGAKKILQNLAG